MLVTQQPKIIQGNMKRPPGAKSLPEVDQFGNPVFVEEQPVFEMVQAEDAEGNKLFKRDRDGRAIGKKMVRKKVRTRKRKFVLDSLGNGQVVKNYDYQPSADEAVRRAASEEARPEAIMAALAELKEDRDKVYRALENLGIDKGEVDKLAEPGRGKKGK